MGDRKKKEGRMIGSVGFPEMMLVVLVALVLFGPTRLPELAKTLGRAVGTFRRTVQEARKTVEDEFHALEKAGEGSVTSPTESEGEEHEDPFPYDALADQPQTPQEEVRARSQAVADQPEQSRP